MSEHSDRISPARQFLLVLLGIVIVWSALGGLLGRIQFSRTLENLNVGTALEARRDGHWLEPTLEGQLRTKKPPLTAWITALAISPQTVRDCSNRDAAVRAHAYAQLAWQSRWQVLAQACATLIAIYFFGRIIGDASTGVGAALLAAGSYLFLRYAQTAQTDIPLMLWVTVSNCLIALAVVRKRWWIGMLGGGAALGLAFLAKGPVAFVEVLAPWIVWKLLADRRGRWRIAPIVYGLLACLVIALPWYLLVFIHDPHTQYQIWFREVTGSDAPDRGEAFFYYVVYLLEFAPTIFVAIPAAVSAFRQSDRPNNRLLMLVCLVVTPIIIMSCFKDKKDRYILPMLGPISVLAAVSVEDWYRKTRAAKSKGLHAGGAFYLVTLAAIPIVFCVLAGVGYPKMFRGIDSRPWLSWPIAGAAIGVCIFVLVVAMRLKGRQIPLFTLIFMALLMHLITIGYYLHSAAGQSKMLGLANQIWADYPTAKLYTTLPSGRASEDLSIYTNRTTGWITVDQMKQLSPGGDPILVIMRQENALPPPVLPPPWRTFATLPKESNESWLVVVLPASAARKNPITTQESPAYVR